MDRSKGFVKEMSFRSKNCVALAWLNVYLFVYFIYLFLDISTDKTETQLIGSYRGSCDIKLEGHVPGRRFRLSGWPHQ